jgi:hypothetical protein
LFILRDQKPDASSLAVGLRNAEELVSDIVLHPSSRLILSQKVVPLEITIERFGNAEPASSRYFSINNVDVAGNSLNLEPVEEQFAPAQYFALSGDRLLKEPSFKRYKSGVRFELTSSGSDFQSDKVVSLQIGAYEDVVVDGSQTRYMGTFIHFSPDEFAVAFWGSEASDFFHGNRKAGGYCTFDEVIAVEIETPGFVALTPEGTLGGVTFSTYEEGLEWLENTLNNDRSLAMDAYEIIHADDYESFLSV